MMGVAITTDELPILKQNNAILAFDAAEAALLEPTSCIRCGRCVAACPMCLMPTKLEKAVDKKDVDAFAGAGYHDLYGMRLLRLFLPCRQKAGTGDSPGQELCEKQGRK